MSIELVFLLDRSGSMHGNESDVIGGVNSLLEEQRANGVEATVSIFKFDYELEEVCKHIPLSEAKLESKDYIPRGSTSLLDSIGKTIVSLGEDYAKNVPVNGVTFTVFTDGYENSSREYTKTQINELIKKQETEWNWEFAYMGAHKDAFDEASSLGFKAVNTTQFDKSAKAFADNYKLRSSQAIAYATSVGSVRSN